MLTLNTIRNDVITELINIGIGNAAAILNSMIDCHLELSVPRVELIQPGQLEEALKDYAEKIHSTVHLGFSGGLDGDALMVFPQAAARRLVALLVHEPEDGPDVDFLCSSTVTEVGNIVINGVVGSLTNMLELDVRYELPYYSEEPLPQWLGRQQEEVAILLIRTRLRVQEQPIEGDFLLCLKLRSAQNLLTRLEVIGS